MGLTSSLMKTILVTGATGFLGKHLVRSLSADYRLVLVAREPAQLARLHPTLGAQHRVVTPEQLMGGNDSELNTTIDGVIHTATSYGRRGESLRELTDCNLRLPLALLDILQSNNAFFINCDTALPESLNDYALSKAQFREWAKRWCSQGDGRFFANLIIEQMIGPEDDNDKFVNFIMSACVNNQEKVDLTPGTQKRDFIYIDDIVSAFRCILENAHDFTGWRDIPLGSGEAISIRDFAELVLAITKAETALNFGAVAYRDNEVMHSQADTTWLRQLGWEAHVRLEQGVRQIVQSMRLSC